MTDDVEQQLLELHDFCPEAVPGPPPAVRIEQRVPGGSNDHLRRMVAQGAAKHPADPARMIGAAHNDDGAELALVAPVEQDVALGFGSSGWVRDHFDVADSEGA